MLPVFDVLDQLSRSIEHQLQILMPYFRDILSSPNMLGFYLRFKEKRYVCLRKNIKASHALPTGVICFAANTA